MSAPPPRPGRPRLVDPELAARVPGLRRVAGIALAVGAVSAALVVVQAVALAYAVDRSLLHHAPLGDLVPAIVVVGLAIVARAVLHGAGDLSAHGAADRVVSRLRGQLLRHALTLGPRWLAGERAGELSLTATRGLRSLHTYFARYLPQAAAAAVVPVLLLVWVATQDWLSFVVVIALVLAVPLTMIYFGREATRRSERQWRRLGSLAGRFLQLVEGLPTLRAFRREDQGRREVAAATEGVRSATMRTLRVAFLSALSMDMIAGFGVGFVAMVLGLRLLWGELGLQTAMAVLLVAPEVFIPLRRAGAEFHASTEGQAAAARVLEVLGSPAPGSLGTRTGSRRGGATRGTVGRGPPERPVRLDIDALEVGYEHRDRPAISSFSLHAEPGSRVALTGPSGSGKSTVLAALLRFVEPSGGALSIDDRAAAAQTPAEWRSCFSWLPQRPHLFNATMAENLRLGAPEAPDGDLLEVLAAVGLSELLGNLPAGLDTPLGHDGLTLSSGERQRVALARALLCPAPILLLDEPTASLDQPTISRVAPSIERWLGGRTVVVAAHEPVLLPRFDTVVALPGARATPGGLTVSGTRRDGSLRRVLREPGTPYGRLAVAGLLGLAAAAATIGLLAGSGYVVGRAALRPGLDAIVGILAAVEVLAFLRGPLRYEERLVGHDAALRALTAVAGVALRPALPPRAGRPRRVAQRRPSGPRHRRRRLPAGPLSAHPAAGDRRRGRRRHRGRRRRPHPAVGRAWRSRSHWRSRLSCRRC